MDNDKVTFELTGEARMTYNHSTSPDSLRMRRRKNCGFISKSLVMYGRFSYPDKGTRTVKDMGLLDLKGWKTCTA